MLKFFMHMHQKGGFTSDGVGGGQLKWHALLFPISNY